MEQLATAAKNRQPHQKLMIANEIDYTKDLQGHKIRHSNQERERERERGGGRENMQCTHSYTHQPIHVTLVTRVFLTSSHILRKPQH